MNLGMVGNRQEQGGGGGWTEVVVAAAADGSLGRCNV